MRRKNGFTLVELLVVVAIIVLLLALLIPAMDRAIYQAELAVCAARLSATASGITTYAFDNARRYPDRDLPPNAVGGRDTPYIVANILASPAAEYDMRPGIRDALNINRMLQCPLTDDSLTLDTTQLNAYPYASYAMWWGWFYKKPAGGQWPGMFKLGDRFEWNDHSYGLLVGDVDRYADQNGYHASHPDEDGILSLTTYNEEVVAQLTVPPGPVTVSLWATLNNPVRGEIDSNYAFVDVSVSRYHDVKQYTSAGDLDPRMDAVPIQWSNVEPMKRFQIPRQ